MRATSLLFPEGSVTFICRGTEASLIFSSTLAAVDSVTIGFLPAQAELNVDTSLELRISLARHDDFTRSL